MATYADMTTEELRAELAALNEEYAAACAKGLALNMARGKPGADQLELSLGMLEAVDARTELTSCDGTDLRNYGVLTGIPEARAFFGEVLGVPAEQVVVFGNSSLNIMFDTVARCMTHGTGGHTPWCKLERVRFLCPAPGYDRHFAICEHFGIEMTPIPMGEGGPDMDLIEALVAEDDAIKGIWCVPQYSNPQGITYSDETVRRFAALQPAAPDFRIFWDNAYCVHHLYDAAEEQDHVFNIFDACAEVGPEAAEREFEFCSSSKVTLPGAGIAAFAGSPASVAEVKATMTIQTIGHDKINQLRHVKFLGDAAGLAAHMARHAELLRPKFECVLEALERDLAPVGVGSWCAPRGGYFIAFDGPAGSAKAIVAKAQAAGVAMTGAGATYPYKADPADTNIRIAPTYPSLEELREAANIFTLCARIVALALLLG